MSFILLHHENSFCGHEACLLNVSQIAAVLPISWHGKIYAERSNATVRMTDGKAIRVKETIDTVMGLLRSSIGKTAPLIGAGPRAVEPTISSITS